MTPDISIILVSYGSREMTLACLRSVEVGAVDARCEIIVVDNGSVDGSPESIAAEFPQVILLRQFANLGFAAACNLAAHEAQGTYLLLLNPDTVVQHGSIDRLLEFARRRPDAGIWGGRTVFADGRLNPTSCSRRLTVWGLFCIGVGLDTRFSRSPLFNSYGYGGWRRDSEREVDVVAGCFLLVRKSLWDSLHGFAEEFFMYGEDVDLCMRAEQVGSRPVVTPEATIVHHGSGTESDKARKIRQLFAARAILIRKYFPPMKRNLGLALLALRPMLGRRFAKPGLRKTWEDVWAFRSHWMKGQF